MKLFDKNTEEMIESDLLMIKSINELEKNDNLQGIDSCKIIEIEENETLERFINKIIKFEDNEIKSVIEFNFSNNLIVKSSRQLIKVCIEEIREINIRRSSNNCDMYLTITSSNHKYAIDLNFPTYVIQEEKKYQLNYNVEKIMDKIILKINEKLKEHEKIKKQSISL